MSQPKIHIFQPYLNQEQKTQIDPVFIPFDHTHNPRPELREYYIYKNLFEKLDKIEADYIGLFSQKFTHKTFLFGQDVVEHIEKNPGYDVYLFNPFPHNNILFYNFWEEAEYQHPRITEITQHLLNKFHRNIILNDLGRAADKIIYCNFWVGSKQFWGNYFSFLIPIVEDMIANPDIFLSTTTYYLGDLPFFPFIVERLFTTFLMTEGRDIKSLAYTYSEDMLSKLMVHEYQREAYKIVAPLAHQFDRLHGLQWPQEAQNSFNDLRKIAFDICDQLKYSRQFRC